MTFMPSSEYSQVSQNAAQAKLSDQQPKIHKIMSFFTDQKNYAMCCLVENEFHIVADRCVADDSFDRVVTYYEPANILLNSKSNKEMEICEMRQIPFELRPSMEFNAEHGKRQIAKHFNKSEIEIDQIISDGQYLIYCCFNVVLGYLTSLGHDAEISEIIFSDVDDVMLLNEDAYLSLDIFEIESHPNQSMKSSKEGLTLFGIMNFTKSKIGYRTLRQWFSMPSTDIGIIENRQKAIQEMLLPRNESLSKRLLRLLAFKSPRKVMDDITPSSSHYEWKCLLNVSQINIVLREYI
eukprot:NODE_461_length_7178_cov_0.667185.p2 type:complete len:294 gc:universal NODE_461_length_7178_cov_0.667185:3616-2735(-)